jgi:hypothetical protein
MNPGYTIENKTPEKGLHFAILVYNWQYLNIIQNAPVVENSFLILKKKDKDKIGLWKLKNLKS